MVVEVRGSSQVVAAFLKKGLRFEKAQRAGLIVVPVLVAVTTGVALLLELPFRNADHVIIYLLAVIIAAVRWGNLMAGYAFLLSCLAIVYFFVPPRRTFGLEFSRYDYGRYLPGLVVFLGLTVFLAYLITALKRERDRAQSLVEREKQARETALVATRQYYEERERAASIEERNRIARDLHDGLAQSINYIGLKTQLVRKLYESNQTGQVQAEIERIGRAAELARSDIREVLYGLRHTENDRPFVLELADMVREAAELSGIKINLTTNEGSKWPGLSLTTQTQLLRIVKEALANVQRHSKARQVEVRAFFVSETRAICLSIKDDGVGFAPEEVDSSGSQHLGLEIMRERAARIKAKLEIISQPGRGTEIRLEHRPRATRETGEGGGKDGS